ncbi:alpha/beta-hydrolase [Glonium stellatum]|uniref:Alpha/beta-hydrolase n=1 Tax=Glonium stellatum TaxID=574774 RepID=A0A8E2FBX4_9PEZI|nr:alpha/beta-hydrolase [Glonium stellatum]
MQLYRALLAAADNAGEKVILVGDSSGGNIILSLTLEALREDQEKVEEIGGTLRGSPRPYPTALMVISPSTDLRRTNTTIKTIEPLDPFLTPTFITSTARAWSGDWDPYDSKLSPLQADVSLLTKVGVKVHGIIGGYDILSPDAVKFRDKCAQEGVYGRWLEWDKQMHCFILTWSYGIPEANEAVSWMIDVLKYE